MNSQDKKSEQTPESEKTVAIPDDLFHSFHKILDMMKDAQRGFHKVAEEMKPNYPQHSPKH